MALEMEKPQTHLPSRSDKTINFENGRQRNRHQLAGRGFVRKPIRKTEWRFGLYVVRDHGTVMYRMKRRVHERPDLFQSFQTGEQAIDYLERVRWHGQPVCPYRKRENIGRHVSGDRGNQRRQCRESARAVSVTVGTLFHGTHMPLRKWFPLIALMLNAKKSASAYRISRDPGIRRPTVWSMIHRIRVAMATDREQSDLLHGIVEADEVYIGGKPRSGNKREEDAPNKRGRGTWKTAVIGIAECLGGAIAKVADAYDLS
ncbi:MAG: IS1595 family transposase [Methylocella sp.]